MEGEIKCWCGDRVSVDVDRREREVDINTSCQECGRRYIITVTEVAGPDET